MDDVERNSTRRKVQFDNEFDDDFDRLNPNGLATAEWCRNYDSFIKIRRKWQEELEDDTINSEEDYLYDYDKYAPQSDCYGRIKHTSFIPPIPMELEQPAIPELGFTFPTSEELEEMRAAILEALKKQQYFQKDIPKPTYCPSVPFTCKSFGFCRRTGRLILKFFDKVGDDEYHKLQNEMDYFFNRKDLTNPIIEPIPFEQIAVQQLVIAKWDEIWEGEGKFVRARVVEINREKELVTVINVDENLTKTLESEHIFYIDKQFLLTPFRVQSCYLEGCEFWMNSHLIPEVLPFVASFDSNSINILKCSLNAEGFYVIIPEVNFKINYKSDQRGRLNVKLLRAIAGFTRVPRKIFIGSQIHFVVLSHAEPNGAAWFQLTSGLVHSLTHVTTTSVDYQKEKACKLFGVSPDVNPFWSAYEKGDKIFLARYNGDDIGWHRIEVLEADYSTDKIVAEYIEFGNVETISSEQIIVSDVVDPLLKIVKKQTIECRLRGIKAILNMEAFFSLVDANLDQVLNVSSFDGDGYPIVELFVILPNQNEYTFINQYVIDIGIAVGRRSEPIKPFSGIPKHLNGNSRQNILDKGSGRLLRSIVGASERYRASCRILPVDEQYLSTLGGVYENN